MPKQFTRILTLGETDNTENVGSSACVIGSGEVGSIAPHDYVIGMLGNGHSIRADYIVAANQTIDYENLRAEDPDCNAVWVYGLRVNAEPPDLEVLAKGYPAVFVEDAIIPYVMRFRNGRRRGYPLRGCMAGILAMLFLDIDGLYFYGCNLLMRGDDGLNGRWASERAALVTISHEKGIMLVDCSL